MAPVNCVRVADVNGRGNLELFTSVEADGASWQDGQTEPVNEFSARALGGEPSTVIEQDRERRSTAHHLRDGRSVRSYYHASTGQLLRVEMWERSTFGQGSLLGCGLEHCILEQFCQS